jgi:hypothetical protein
LVKAYGEMNATSERVLINAENKVCGPRASGPPEVEKEKILGLMRAWLR